jgi:hypothetical protein
VVIRDYWYGMNSHAPLLAAWELRSAPGGGLCGEGRFSTKLAAETTVEVTVSADEAAQFFAAIASLRLMPGEYEPTMLHTDDFPSIRVEIHGAVTEGDDSTECAVLFTESQGEFYSPWGARVSGQVYTVPGEDLGRALAALHVPLKRDTLERMVSEVRRRSSWEVDE